MATQKRYKKRKRNVTRHNKKVSKIHSKKKQKIQKKEKKKYKAKALKRQTAPHQLKIKITRVIAIVLYLK